MRTLFAVLWLVCAPVAAIAQLTPTDVQNSINYNLPSCGDMCISASALRSTLATMNQATFQFTQFPNTFTAIQSIIVPLSLPTSDGAQLLIQNGSKTALSIYTPGAPTGTFIYGNVRSVIDSEPGMDIQNYNAYDAFIYNNNVWNSGSVPHAHASVGLEIFAVNAVAGAATFGINPAFSDSPNGGSTSFASTMVGGELDYTVYNTGSVVTGFSLVVQGVQPAGANVINALYNPATAARWTNGYILSDGALQIGGAGLLLGLQGAASGNSISSGSAVFNATDSSGTEHHVALQAQPNGASAVLLSLTDGIGGTATALQVAALYGGVGAASTLTLQSTSSGAPSGDSVQIKAGGSAVATINSVNGLLMGGFNVIQVGSLASNSVGGYELLAGTAAAATPTLIPNKADTKAGIGGASGNVSIVVDNAGTATEVIRGVGTGALINLPSVGTGTPAASLCLDGSGNIIKKTTTGSCV